MTVYLYQTSCVIYLIQLTQILIPSQLYHLYKYISAICKHHEIQNTGYTCTLETSFMYNIKSLGPSTEP